MCKISLKRHCKDNSSLSLSLSLSLFVSVSLSIVSLSNIFLQKIVWEGRFKRHKETNVQRIDGEKEIV